ncbi:MAG: hypothetical protein PHE87_08050 [Victivallaceae bacterium]|nr:hypothetical protein [Victivallaceae bacterium]
MRGYKVFLPDFTCHGFKFEVGKTYKHDGEIELCNSGFHFCKKAVDCFNYHGFDPDNIVCEIDAIGLVKESSSGAKCVTSEIHIVRRLSWNEVLEIVNIGHGNSGYANSGHINSGNYCSGGFNSGNCNSGSYNSGNSCSGHVNSGYGNSGDGNSGNYCSGSGNPGSFCSGNGNSGSFCSGNYNSGNFNSGFFNTDEPRVRAFNRDTGMTRDEFKRLMPDIRLSQIKWVVIGEMTNEEKSENPSCKTTGGFLRRISYKDAWRDWWKGASANDRLKIKNLPNFDATIFEDITGIDVNQKGGEE